MAKKDLGFTVTINGDTKNLKNSISELDKTISKSTKNIKELEQATKINPNNLTAYLAKHKETATAIEATKEKLKILKEAQKEVEKEFKAGNLSAAQYSQFQKELEGTKSKLNQLQSSSKLLNVDLKSLASTAGNVGATMAKGLAVGVTAIAALSTTVVAALSKITMGAASAADDLNTMSAVTGISTQELQKMNYAADVLDVSTETISGSMRKMINNMQNAQKGTGEAGDAFEKLGVSVTDSNGNLKDSQLVFGEVIDALGKVANETERDALSMDIFGKSAMDLNPLIKGGAETLKELGTQAENAGLILSQDMLDTLNDSQDQIDIFNSNIEQMGLIIGAQFAPILTTAGSAVNEFLLSLSSAFQEGGMEAVGKQIMTSFESMLVFLNENLPQFMNIGFDLLMNIINGILENMDGIVDVVLTIIQNFLNSFIENLPQVITMGIQLILKIAEGLLKAIPMLLSAIPQIIGALLEGFAGALPSILQIGVNIVQGVWQGITSMAGWFREQISNFFGGIVDGVKNVLGINSPSKVFAEIGMFSAQGFGVGFNKEFGSVKGSINKEMSRSTSVVQNLTFNGGYKQRDGMNITRDINRKLGLAYL